MSRFRSVAAAEAATERNREGGRATAFCSEERNHPSDKPRALVSPPAAARVMRQLFLVRCLPCPIHGRFTGDC